MKKKRRLKPKVRRLLTFIFAIVLFGYVSFSVVNYHVLKNKYELEQAELTKKLHDLKDEETDLNQEISKLKDDDYLARYAREEYLYSKDGEYVIKIEDKSATEVENVQEEKQPAKFILLNIFIAIIFVIGLVLIIMSKKKKVLK